MSSSALAKHVAKLREARDKEPASKTTGIVAKDALLFWASSGDKEFLPQLKSCVGSHSVFLHSGKVDTLAEVKLKCKSTRVRKIISTNVSLLQKLLHWDRRKGANLKNYAGSYFTIPAALNEKDPEIEGVIEIVFIPPLKQLVTVPYGKFMTARLISKLTAPQIWYQETEFNWAMLTPENEAKLFEDFSSAFLISVDVETLKNPVTIRCVSYTAFWYDDTTDSGFRSFSVVLPLDTEYSVSIMQKWNAQLPAQKVMQGGNYDNAYFCRFSAPLYNYIWDTGNLFHSWFSELPKDLGFLNAFFIRKAIYWKDLSDTNDLHEYYRYNALDTWGTGNCFLAMMKSIPQYAKENYCLEFPLMFPCHLAEMTGIERDLDKLKVACEEQQKIIDSLAAELNVILGIPEGQSFNTNSPPQVKALLKILGCGDLPKADEKSLSAAMFRHPLNSLILEKIINVRKARKLVSTYLTAGKEFSKEDGTGNRILFTLKPQGTDSARLASSEHHFWCGLQIQNIPRGPIVKSTLKADPGFFLAEADLAQAESRDTAYISGDANLIEAVEYSPDFHSYNASKFFGVPFEEIYNALTHAVLNAPLRQLAKPVNHGANYNMQARTLIAVMGLAKIVEAKELLKLPSSWSHMKVAEYLLEQFHKTYPGIKKVYYAGVIEEIQRTHRLTSTAVHYPTTKECTFEAWKDEYERAGVYHWTRYCFANPERSKPALNTYISHPPQSLNAITLNKAWLRVFYAVAMHPVHGRNIKLIAQIHDSILFMWRQGHEYIKQLVVDAMQIPILIKGYDEEIRYFTVPADIKDGSKKGKPAIYWNETE
jgi:DNA polymerase I-like protein with 3'-5' exonuclease and polymerase domains